MTAKSGSLVLAIALGLVPAIAQAQTSSTKPAEAVTKPAEPIVSPGMSQSASELGKDKRDCFEMAKKETGFSPDTAAKNSAAAANDTAKDTAKGSSSSIGSSASGAAQGAKDQASSLSASSDEKLSAYYKAYGDCMKSHGYTVKASQ
jgi:hypothetical protein